MAKKTASKSKAKATPKTAPKPKTASAKKPAAAKTQKSAQSARAAKPAQASASPAAIAAFLKKVDSLMLEDGKSYNQDVQTLKELIKQAKDMGEVLMPELTKRLQDPAYKTPAAAAQILLALDRTPQTAFLILHPDARQDYDLVDSGKLTSGIKKAGLDGFFEHVNSLIDAGKFPYMLLANVFDIFGIEKALAPASATVMRILAMPIPKGRDPSDGLYWFIYDQYSGKRPAAMADQKVKDAAYARWLQRPLTTIYSVENIRDACNDGVSAEVLRQAGKRHFEYLEQNLFLPKESDYHRAEVMKALKIIGENPAFQKSMPEFTSIFEKLKAHLSNTKFKV